MAQSYTVKQTGFISRYAAAVQGLISQYNLLLALDVEFTQNNYGSGGANQLTDALVQTVLPASTAALFDSGEGAVVTICASITSNIGYLETFVP